ncbi:MAG: amino acid adenylation domain-containing protein, partial [Cyclobacteriaceae bacterium]
IKATVLPKSIAHTPYELLFDMTKDHEGYTLDCDYNADLFNETTILRFAAYFQEILKGIGNTADCTIAELNILPASETDRLLNTFNPADTTYPYAPSIGSLIEEQAALTPEATAIMGEKENVTYRQLNTMANRLASYCIDKFGAEIGKTAGIMMDRSVDMLVAMLAILKTGATYVPIDPVYPRERKDYIVEDSGMNFIISQPEYLEGLSKQIPAITYTKEFADGLVEQKSENPDSRIKPEDAAYLIYTSGSTGKPKGVVIAHSNAVAFLHWAKEEFASTDFEVVYAVSSICFDLSIFELFYPLTVGKTIRILPNGLYISRFLSHDNKVLLNTVPSVVYSLLREGADFSEVVAINMAGEEIPASIQQSLDCQKIEVRNLYGPSEDTTYSTFHRLDGRQFPVPIGKPIANTQAYILDENLELLPLGVVGELCLSGEGVAQGYLHRPDLTHEKFIDNPYRKGQKLYRTGDLARWTEDGVLEFKGRKDYQVKLRGYRIELGEVERCLEKHPALQSVAVVIRYSPGSKTEKDMVAFFTSKEEAPSAGQLEALLLESLPAYMIPRHFVALDNMPLSANGKINRFALPENIGEDQAKSHEPVAPANETETQLLSLWQQVLNKSGFGVTESFTSLGGHSLKASELIFRIQKEMGVKLEMKSLFTSPTIQAQAALIESTEYSELQPIPHMATAESYPVTPSQQRLWILDQASDGATMYNMPGAFTLQGMVDHARLSEAFSQLVARHESLRTNFITANGEVRQKVLAAETYPFALEYTDLQQEDNDIVQKLISDSLTRSFDLKKGPLFSVQLIQTAPAEHILLLNMHHIASDGWSMRVLVNEVMQYYVGIQPEPLKIQYKDYTAWQINRLSGEKTEADKQYWLQKLSDELPVLEVITDYPRPKTLSYRGDTLRFTLDQQKVERLKKIASNQDATFFMVLMASVKALLYYYTGQQDIILGTPVSGRAHPDLENQIGFFVNTIPLRTSFKAYEGFSKLVEDVKTSSTEAYAHQEYPFGLLLEHLDLPLAANRSPLFDVVVSWIDADNSFEKQQIGNITASELILEHGTSKFDFAFAFREIAEGLEINLEYSTELFTRKRMQRMLSHYSNLMDKLTVSPDTSLQALPVLSEEEKAVLLDYNEKTDYPAQSSITDLFKQIVQKHGDKVAVGFENHTLTYSQLDDLSDKLAAYLLAEISLQPEDKVAFCLDRSEQMIVVILGILKAGGCYVPLDKTYPEQRLRHMLSDTAARCIFTDDEEWLGRFELQDSRIVGLDKVFEAMEGADNQVVRKVNTPDSLAYIMYTSGSTGTPKGVMVEHRNVVRLVRNTNYVTLDAQSRLLLTGALTFDATTFEIWGMLLNGGTLHILPQEKLMNIQSLKQAI